MERTGNWSVRLGHMSLEHCGADWQSERAAGTGHRNTAERALEQVTGTLRSGLTIGACGLATGVLAGAELKPVIKIEEVNPINRQTDKRPQSAPGDSFLRTLICCSAAAWLGRLAPACEGPHGSWYTSDEGQLLSIN